MAGGGRAAGLAAATLLLVGLVHGGPSPNHTAVLNTTVTGNFTLAPVTNGTLAPVTNTTTLDPVTNKTVGPTTPNRTTVMPVTNTTRAPTTNQTTAPVTNYTLAPVTNQTGAPTTNGTEAPATNRTTAASSNGTGAPMVKTPRLLSGLAAGLLATGPERGGAGVCERLMRCGAGACPICDQWEQCLDRLPGQRRGEESLQDLRICLRAGLTRQQCAVAKRDHHPITIKYRLLSVYCGVHEECSARSRRGGLEAAWGECVGAALGPKSRFWSLLAGSCGAFADGDCPERRSAALTDCMDRAGGGDVPRAISRCVLPEARLADAATAVEEEQPAAVEEAPQWVRLGPAPVVEARPAGGSLSLDASDRDGPASLSSAPARPALLLPLLALPIFIIPNLH